MLHFLGLAPSRTFRPLRAFARKPKGVPLFAAAAAGAPDADARGPPPGVACDDGLVGLTHELFDSANLSLGLVFDTCACAKATAGAFEFVNADGRSLPALTCACAARARARRASRPLTPRPPSSRL